MSKAKKIAIIDYGLGNLFSVLQACKELGADAEITSDLNKIKNSDGMILPGVGAFGQAMQNLEALGITNVLKDEVANGKSLFGVCLGLQLLFTESEEFGRSEGLNLIPGKVKKFPSETIDHNRLRVPQIAWNKIYACTSEMWQSSPLKSLPDGEFMYFVHSYYVQPEDKKCALTKTTYGGYDYYSSVQKDNIFAVQFHPEKSGPKGLEIYNNWLSSLK
ncbi:MAG: imidazole glycerol phosphate synthase subunit HisH [Bdellovibrionota bacterium]